MMMFISNIIATSCPKGLQSSSPSPCTQRRLLWCRMSNLPFRVPELAYISKYSITSVYVEGESIVYPGGQEAGSRKQKAFASRSFCIAAGLQTANATKRQFCLTKSLKQPHVTLHFCGSANGTSCCFSPCFQFSIVKSNRLRFSILYLVVLTYRQDRSCNQNNRSNGKKEVQNSGVE